jgi:hypothetical protein
VPAAALVVPGWLGLLVLVCVEELCDDAAACVDACRLDFA